MTQRPPELEANALLRGRRHGASAGALLLVLVLQMLCFALAVPVSFWAALPASGWRAIGTGGMPLALFAVALMSALVASGRHMSLALLLCGLQAAGWVAVWAWLGWRVMLHALAS